MGDLPEVVPSDQKDKPTQRNIFQRFKATKVWTAIEILSPILAIVIPLTLYYYSVKSGQLTVRGIQRTSLINTRSEIGQDLTVQYRNNRIASLVSYTLEISNTGNTDIGKEDIYRLRWFPPLTSQIIDARIIGKTGDYSDFISLDVTDPHVLIMNVLVLNRGVGARVNILCSSDATIIDDSTSHIDGVVRGASIIDNSKNFNTSERNTFIENVFAGGFWTNVAKALIFFLITLFIVVLVIVSVIGIENRRSNRRNARDVAKERQMVLSILDRKIDPDQLKEDRIRWLAETINFFKNLTQEQFDVCSLVVRKTPEGKVTADLLLGDALTHNNKETLRQIPNKEIFFNEILRWPTLHKPEVVIEALVESGKFADNRIA